MTDIHSKYAATDIHSKYAALRQKFPDDIARIEADERALSALLHRKEYAELEETKRLMALCRTDIRAARVKLATDRSLTEAQRAELWQIIDARDWFLKLVTRDYDAELAQIDAELDAELSR